MELRRPTSRNTWLLLCFSLLVVLLLYTLKQSNLVMRRSTPGLEPRRLRVAGGRFTVHLPKPTSATPAPPADRVIQVVRATSAPQKSTVKPAPIRATGVPRLVEYSDKELPNYQITSLKVRNQANLKIYIHGPTDLISRDLIYHHTWEAGRLRQVNQVLQRDPTLHLVDIGSNLGVFTLTAASMGRKVLALDANLENLKRLRKSVLANNFQDRVRIVYNALSDRYSTVEMGIVRNNIGGSIAIATDRQENFGSVYKKNGILVPTIFMDDLLTVISFKRCMIKMDIEGYEYFALRRSQKFFKQLDVPVVLMEWSSTKLDHRRAMWVIKYFTKLGYVACSDTLGSSRLSGSYRVWPGDINWVKKI